jgi:replicative DNA helicase
MTSRFDPDYATVGGLMLAPEHYDVVREWLRPEDFARPLCGEIFELVGGLRASARPVDPVTVFAELRERGKVRKDGYPGNELIVMVQTVPVPASTPYYARQVLSDSVFRHVEQCGIRLAQVGRARRGGAPDALGLATEALTALNDVRRRWALASRPARSPDIGLGWSRGRALEPEPYPNLARTPR